MEKPRGIHESRHAPGERLASHRHDTAYAALVLDGGYDEISADGRVRSGPGWLVLHPVWHAHADEFGAAGAVVLNLPLGPALADACGYGAAPVPDADGLARLIRRDPAAAVREILDRANTLTVLRPPAWLAAFAAALAESPAPLAALARRHGVSPEHASRMCARWYGSGPALLRREGRLRRALALLRDGAAPAEAAAEAGFADQPHLTRVVKAATGRTPARLRAA